MDVLLGQDTYKNIFGMKFPVDPYWEDIKKVSEAGFLDEYVWAFFHRDSWPENEKPSKLDTSNGKKRIYLIINQ